MTNENTIKSAELRICDECGAKFRLLYEEKNHKKCIDCRYIPQLKFRDSCTLMEISEGIRIRDGFGMMTYGFNNTN